MWIFEGCEFGVNTEEKKVTLSKDGKTVVGTFGTDGAITWADEIPAGPASELSTITTTPAYSGGTGTQADPYIMTVQEGKTGSISVAVKESNGSTTTADSITYTSVASGVATVSPASDTNVSSSTATVTGVTEDETGSVITINIDGVTKYVQVVVSGDPTAVGSTVTYTTKLNNTDLTMEWKVFHKETKNNTEYVWIILGVNVNTQMYIFLNLFMYKI